ncbi:MAG: helix-turn-helix domain-containing protein [Nitrospinota bacterium]
MFRREPDQSAARVPKEGDSPRPEEARSLEELGAFLRSLREKRGISPIEIAAATKVRLHYLDALEAGDFRRLPGGIYRKGYLRAYLSALNQSPAPWVKRFEDLVRRKESIDWTNLIGSLFSFPEEEMERKPGAGTEDSTATG